ncbi:AraC family transcriptional regulator [Streptomyces xanthochromogenes]|uniref:AraC family transcriptional regulator n=1 Tax=Streptomyces TaxID=1883 RepID=UPI00136E90F8|nr:AraC family transcriptional regulator [Streptomyces sp. SID1034]MYV96328.1 helix-turn-helix domain-containing protein [Streptomyces sp. SID1034]
MANSRGVPLWDSLTIERRIIPDQGRMTYQPRQDWFTIVAPLRGLCQFEYPDDSGWHRTTLVSGDTSRLVGKSAVRLWQPPAGKQRAEVAFIALPTQHFRYYADEHPEVDLRDLSSLETPRVFDPVAAAMAPGLLRARDAGVGEHYAFRAAHYLTAHLLHPHIDQRSDTHGLNPERLLAVTDYMRENLASHITLEDMAREALLSRYHFVRQFSTATGKTPVQYLTELRVETACHLLTTSGELISQVGTRCGFPNAGNFARVFRKHLGCSPLQYRQRSEPS